MVLACGAWSRDLGRKVGVQVPIRSNKHGYVVSDIIPGISAYPNVRHYDYNIYFKVQLQFASLLNMEYEKYLIEIRYTMTQFLWALLSLIPFSWMWILT